MGDAVRWIDRVRVEDDGITRTLVVGDGEPVELDPVSAAVADLVDGERDAAAIAALAMEHSGGDVTREQAWSALDLLADLGALRSRATPPSGGERMSRRQLFGRAAIGGAVVVAYPIVTAGQAAAEGLLGKVLGPILGGGEQHAKHEEQECKGEAGTKGAEQQTKEQESKEQDTKTAEQDAKGEQFKNNEHQAKEQQGKEQQDKTAEQQAKGG